MHKKSWEELIPCFTLIIMRTAQRTKQMRGYTDTQQSDLVNLRIKRVKDTNADEQSHTDSKTDSKVTS